MPSMETKQREEILRSLLHKIDEDIRLFTTRAQELHAKHEGLTDAIMKAGLQPVPIHFPIGDGIDVLNELELHILELNKLRNLVNMKLKRVTQEEELLMNLHEKFGTDVSFRRGPKGVLELEVHDPQSQEAYSLLQHSRERMDELRKKIHELGDNSQEEK